MKFLFTACYNCVQKKIWPNDGSAMMPNNGWCGEKQKSGDMMMAK